MIKDIVGDGIDTKIENSLTVEVKVTDSVAKGYHSLITQAKLEK